MNSVNQKAQRKRMELLASLGERCLACGSDEEPLQLDHIRPIDWIPSRLNQYSRMLEYEKAHKENNLETLCISCHAKKTRAENRSFDSDLFPF